MGPPCFAELAEGFEGGVKAADGVEVGSWTGAGAGVPVFTGVRTANWLAVATAGVATVAVGAAFAGVLPAGTLAGVTSWEPLQFKLNISNFLRT